MPSHPLESAWQKKPGDPAATCAWAEHLLRYNLHSKAIEVLQGTQRAHPQHRQLNLLLNHALLACGLTDAAILQLREFALQHPDDVQIQMCWGATLMMHGRLPDALAVYKRQLHALLQTPPVAANPAPTPAYDAAKAEPLLWQTLAKLASAGLHAFATSGTLLGLVRDGRLLPWDKDMDIGIPWPEMKAAIHCLQQNGWVEWMNSFGLSNPRAFAHPATGLLVDLCGFAHDDDTDKTLGGFWMPDIPPHWNRITEYPRLALQRHTSAAGEVWTLQSPTAWLAALYGPDWRIPDPDFDTLIGAHNQRGFSVLSQCYAAQRILRHLLQGQWHKARASAGHAARQQPAETLWQRLAGLNGETTGKTAPATANPAQPLL